MKSSIDILKTILLSILLTQLTVAEPWKEVINLEGKWKFSIGDKASWKNININESGWITMEVPGSWETQGFYGYNGYAWYRTSFQLNETPVDKKLYLHLGRIDDVDEVFFNGVKVGGNGSFLPNYQTAYHMSRKYEIPTNLINPKGKNIIAVRVFDGGYIGGILEGPVGIYTLDYIVTPEIDLRGIWKFKKGDSPVWKNVSLSENDWYDMYVPDEWRGEGLTDYDGFAWYRKEVIIPSSLKNSKLFLLLGKIDDLDETFFNGEFIGGIGHIGQEGPIHIEGDEYSEVRYYEIPKELIKWDKKNTIAVRVYDGLRNGGIYEGPVGIMKAESVLSLLNININGNKDENTWKRIFRLFN